MLTSPTELRKLLPLISYWETDLNGDFRVHTTDPVNQAALVAQTVPYSLVEQLHPKLPLTIYGVEETSFRNSATGGQVMNTLMLLEGRDIRFIDTDDNTSHLLAVYSLKRTVMVPDCLRIEGASIVTSHVYVNGERLTYANDVKLYRGTATLASLSLSYPGFTERLHVAEELGLNPNELPGYVFTTTPQTAAEPLLTAVQFD